MRSGGPRGLAGPGYSRKQIIQPSPEVPRGFPPDPKDLLVTQPFGFAPFDWAPFDFAPFDCAQGLREGPWQALRRPLCQPRSAVGDGGDGKDRETQGV